MREVVKKENPELAYLDVIKKVAEKYKTIDPALMKKFEHEYSKDNEKWLREKFQYETKLTLEQRQNIMDAKEAQKERKKKIAYKKVNF
jgi:hypothetical protein